MGETAVSSGDWGLVPPQLPLPNSHPFPLLPRGLPSGKGSRPIRRRAPPTSPQPLWHPELSLHGPASVGLLRLVHWHEPSDPRV